MPPPAETLSWLRGEFRRLHEGLAAIGRDPGGGWTRWAWTAEDDAARAWFSREAAAVGMDVEADRNGNLWAYWPPIGPGGGDPAPLVGTGSHLDTVRNGGAYDGALGVICGLLAVRLLAQRGVRPDRRVCVAAFADEEGGRFGLATFGSRLSTGALPAGDLSGRVDGEGARLMDVLAGRGWDPGPDLDRLGRVAGYVEVHVEQGRGLVDLDAPLAVATGIWPHGRWRLRLAGEGNHAGTTRLADRRDPALPLAVAIRSAREQAQACAGVATVGRIELAPNSTNSVPAAATAWLDARAPQRERLARLVAVWTQDVTAAADAQGVSAEVVPESETPAVEFDDALSERLAVALGARGLPAPRLATAAGHDAGALAAVVPTAMLFVRNPTGASHTPSEQAADEDCALAAEVLADVLQELACP